MSTKARTKVATNANASQSSKTAAQKRPARRDNAKEDEVDEQEVSDEEEQQKQPPKKKQAKTTTANNNSTRAQSQAVVSKKQPRSRTPSPKPKAKKVAKPSSSATNGSSPHSATSVKRSQSAIASPVPPSRKAKTGKAVARTSRRAQRTRSPSAASSHSPSPPPAKKKKPTGLKSAPHPKRASTVGGSRSSSRDNSPGASTASTQPTSSAKKTGTRVSRVASHAKKSNTSTVSKTKVVAASQPAPQANTTTSTAATRKSQAPPAPVRSKSVPRKTIIRGTALPVPTYSAKVKGGQVFAVGQNTMAQLGLKTSITERTNPQPVLLPELVIQIAAGPLHSVCLTNKGSVFTFGCNDEHALGRIEENEDDDDADPFDSVDLSATLDKHEKVVQVVAGDSHTVILTDQGKVYGWGTFRSSTNGIYGLVKRGRMAKVPKEMHLPEKVVKLASGNDFVLFLGESGIVYSCGNGEAGQLGRLNRYVAETGRRGGTERLITPDKVQYLRPKGLIDNRPVYFDDIFASAHNFFLKARHHDQIILGGGLNNYHQLGLDAGDIVYFPTHIKALDGKKWKKFAGGLHHTLGLTEDGEVYAWGRFHEGQLGIAGLTNHLDEPTLIPNLPAHVIDIGCGNHVSFLIDKQGKVYSFGAGTSLQHGHGTGDIQLPTLMVSKFMDTKKISSVSVGAQHTLFLSSD